MLKNTAINSFFLLYSKKLQKSIYTIIFIWFKLPPGLFKHHTWRKHLWSIILIYFSKHIIFDFDKFSTIYYNISSILPIKKVQTALMNIESDETIIQIYLFHKTIKLPLFALFDRTLLCTLLYFLLRKVNL